mmetsp:Transcript_14045/g.17203  ORF Transcript_14045/g.17203 Transcript_14045/m.17203 type:complete len:94 (-) Transcript_14045:313-594(-)
MGETTHPKKKKKKKRGYCFQKRKESILTFAVGLGLTKKIVYCCHLKNVINWMRQKQPKKSDLTKKKVPVLTKNKPKEAKILPKKRPSAEFFQI